MNAIRFLQRNIDSEKLARILEHVYEMKILPIMNMSGVTDTACTLISSYFVNRVTYNLFNVLNMLFKETLVYTDFSLLAQSTTQIVSRMTEQRDLKYI